MPRLPVLVLALVAGCGTTEEEPTPTLTVGDTEVDAVDWDGARLSIALTVQDGTLDAGQLSLMAAQVEVWSGAAAATVSIDLDYSSLYAAVEPTWGEDAIAAVLTGSVTSGATDLTVQTDVAIPAARLPEVSVLSVDVDSYDAFTKQGEVEIRLGVSNPLGTLIHINTAALSIALDGFDVFAGNLDTLANVAGGAHDSPGGFLIPVDFSTLDPDLASTLLSHRPVDVAVTGTANVDSPWGDLPLTIDVSAQDVGPP